MPSDYIMEKFKESPDLKEWNVGNGKCLVGLDRTYGLLISDIDGVYEGIKSLTGNVFEPLKFSSVYNELGEFVNNRNLLKFFNVDISDIDDSKIYNYENNIPCWAYRGEIINKIRKYFSGKFQLFMPNFPLPCYAKQGDDYIMISPTLISDSVLKAMDTDKEFVRLGISSLNTFQDIEDSLW